MYVCEPIKDFLKKISNIDGLTTLDISNDIAAESISLSDDFHGDPADRIIVSTTKVTCSTLLTRDSKILYWAASWTY